MTRIELDGIVKRYGDEKVVDGIDLTVEDGQLAVLLGPSGCGKTTTLRMIAGLEPIADGELRFDGRRVNEEPPERRNVGMVFQNYALYPHMTVAANLSFGLESRTGRAGRKAIRTRVLELARLLEIDHVLDHRPKELSGGQRQRVALGRALIREPDVFLLDEPLSNLDAHLRDKMRMELARLHADLPITTVYVTHDQSEALTLADLLVVMERGRIRQAAPPSEVYAWPADTFVAGFLGAPGMNLWTVPVAGQASVMPAVSLGSNLLEGALGEGALTVGIRPEHLVVARGESALSTRVTCEVRMVENLGSHLLVHAELAAHTVAPVVAKLDVDAGVRRGDRVVLGARDLHVHLFDSATGRRLEPGGRGIRALGDRSSAEARDAVMTS